MDPAAIGGFITGGGGLVVAGVTGWWAKRSKDKEVEAGKEAREDELGIAYVKLALERQATDISRLDSERAAQDLTIGQLREEVRECHKDKNKATSDLDKVTLDLIEERRHRQRLEERVASLERRPPPS